MSDRTVVNISDIKIEPRRFQFRLGNIAEDGTRGKLAGVEVYNPIFADTILLWQDKGGQLFLVDGHEGLALAKRSRVSQLEGFVMKETDNITVEDALKEGIDVNIAKRHYSASELAVIFKRYGITLDYLKKEMINAGCEENLQALAMVNLCDDVFDIAVAGNIPETLAAFTGKYVKSYGLQRIIAEKIKEDLLDEIPELIQVVSEEIIDRKFFDSL